MTPAERAQIDAEIKAALAKDGIITHYLARFEFKSETVHIWTGQWAIQPTGTGDAKLEENTFQPFIDGTPYDIGSNKYSEQGSDAFEMVLAVPADLPPELQAASIDENEYLARPAIIWRAVMTIAPGVGTPGVWRFTRVRTGRMDQLQFTQDNSQNIVKLTIEGWASYISDATGSTYADQKRFDSADTSQNCLSSTANGQPIANSQSNTVSYNGGGADGFSSYQDF